MTTHYFKIALRNMRRFKLQTIVCLTGLAVGMTCFALGTLWLRFIESFEDFIPDADRVYIAAWTNQLDRNGYLFYSPAKMGERMMEKHPEVEAFSIFMPAYDRSVAAEGKDSMDMKVAEADERFLGMFGIKALQGDASHLRGDEIALTESAARRLFGDKAALGQVVTVPVGLPERDTDGVKERKRMVTAIIPDCPDNSQFQYEAIAGLKGTWLEKNSYVTFRTFVKLHKNADKGKLANEQGQMMFKDEYTISDGFPYHTDYLLIPLRSLRTDDNAHIGKISTTYVRWFMFIGLVVILCSLANYLLTMVSHLKRRGWEMSLRRVLGASVRSILVMVGTETVILFILSAALALLLTWLVMPSFREYSEITLPLSAIALRLVGYLFAVILASLAASSFTAWLIMKRTQRNILSSRQLSHASHSLDRYSVILQMALAMGIIFILVIMLRQINFLMYSEDMGFDHSNLGMVHGPGLDEELRHKIRQSPLLDGKPVDIINPIYPRHSNPSLSLSAERKGETVLEPDFYYIDTLIYDFYRMTLVAGRLPIPNRYGTESIGIDTVEWRDGHPIVCGINPPKEICVNEAMCKAMKWKPEHAIGQSFYINADELRVCGVLQNACIYGPTIPVAPATYMNLYDDSWEEVLKYREFYFQFRTKPGRLAEMIDSVKAWADGHSVNVSNNEADFNKDLESEMMLIKILLAVGGASLFVCVIGTFSLVSLSLQQRRKEIAVRKVHGARMKDILGLFLKGQAISLCLAAVVAYPIAYIIMRHWLEGYAKQVGIDWWLLPLTFLGIAAVVLGTITLKIWRAAKESTVEALNS